MDTHAPIDLGRLRKSCAQCSLHALCLPASIGAADLARLDDIVKRKRPLQKGDRLFRVGSRLEALFVARDGAFKTVALDEEGRQQVIGFHLPGELIGLDGLASGEHRCDAEALAPASVCEVPFGDLEKVAGMVPGLQHQLLRVIGQSMGRDHDHLEMLGRKGANERMALFLHTLSERYRALGQSPTEVHLPMSREDIASYLGMVIETVSRTLTRLQDDGLISVRGRQLRILDARALNALAHGLEADPRQAGCGH